MIISRSKEPERKKLKTITTATNDITEEAMEDGSTPSAASSLTSKDYYFDSYSHFG